MNIRLNASAINQYYIICFQMKNAILILFCALIAFATPPPVSYPVRFTYIDIISSWTSQSAILAGLGVPGYAKSHSYNYIALAFWSYSGPLDMVKAWNDPVKYIGASPDLGSTKDQIQKSIKKKYNDAGIYIFISAFGATQMPTNLDPATVATSLATFVKSNNLDGVDIDYEDNNAMTLSTAQNWLITFQKKLRQLLPDHLITHAPQAPYFSTVQYRGGGYITIHKAVGSTIDFYNVQFYNQGSTTYDTYDTLFKRSNGWSTGTSVQEMINNGIPSKKIVVGKPATQIDASNTGIVNSVDLGNWCLQAYQEMNWTAGVMFWQYKSDGAGIIINNAAAQLIKASGGSSAVIPVITNTTTITNSTTTNITTPNTTTNTTTQPQTNNSTVIPIPPSGNRINYPIRFTYIDALNSWWPASAIAAGMATPGFAKNHTYNYVALAFWTTGGSADIAKVWENPITFMGGQSTLGKTNAQIRTSLKQAYNNNGVKIMVSAFGSTDMPTGKDPIVVATNLANFVLINNLDGCDIDYEDNAAMEAGLAEAWLISFTRKLRQLLPTQIISHAPQAPYFKKEYYKNGAYITIDQQVGNLIDFYNVQFYNQGDTKYDTYTELFTQATGFFSGTSVKEIIGRGIPSNKIVVGKPASAGDVMNSGLVSAADLGTWTSRAYTELGWYGGVMYWQYKSDLDGSVIKTATSSLMSKYSSGIPAINTTTTNATTIKNTTVVTNVTANTTTANTTTPTNTTIIPTIIPTIKNITTTNTTNTSTPTPTTNITIVPSTPNITVTNTTTNITNQTIISNITIPTNKTNASRVNYPVRFVYVDFINIWWPATAVAAALGVPGYAKAHTYNYIALAFWSDAGPLDIVHVWSSPTYFFGTASVFGSTDAQIQTNLKKAYNNAGISILISAFGSSYLPTNKDPVLLATKLGQFVLANNLDGCDIDYQDNYAMQIGNAEPWLIAFTRKLRQLLPNKIITHAPKAPFFKSQYYPKGGYFTVDKQVGSLIDFYNVQFYNQGTTKYSTYQQIFVKSAGLFTNTSVSEIIARGVPSNKIVVGKPATSSDVMNTGYVSLSDLGAWTTRAFKELNWYAGVMFWQYKSDLSGIGIRNATSGLVSAYKASGLSVAPQLIAPALSIVDLVIPTNKINYPICFTWVNSLASWWPADSLLASLAVSGYAAQSMYNYISYSLWTYEQGPTGSAKVWNDPVSYLSTETGLGTRKSQIQSNILKKFHDKGIKVLVSVFGQFQMPTTKGVNPFACARRLSKFVLSNQLDGVDINYFDHSALAAGTSQVWLTTFSRQLRRLLPTHIISHSVKLSFFKIPEKGYNSVNNQVGDLIDFYNILYLQDEVLYDTYEEIFGDSENVGNYGSIDNLIKSGIPSYKLVVGKQARKDGLSREGWVKPTDIDEWANKAFNDKGWYAGLALWQYTFDGDGSIIMTMAGNLKTNFLNSKNQN